MSATATTIPAELVERPQWVAWRWEERAGKRTKVPVNPCTGRNASPTNPATWGSYAQAHARVRRDDLPGVGFLFTADDPFFGVDLDDCRDIETGALDARATRLVAQFATYTEVSASGSGLHIVGRGRKPGARCRDARYPGIEVYEHSRLLCVTGQVLDGYTTIAARQEPLTALYAAMWPPEPPRTPTPPPSAPTTLDDAALIALALRAANGSRFRALFVDGDVGSYGDDDSAADLALCNLLTFYCGPDPERVDRLFRQSALYANPGRAERWERPARSGETYGAGTIRLAIDGCRDVYHGAPPRPATNGHDGDTREGLAGYVTVGVDDCPATVARLREQLAAMTQRAEQAEAEATLWKGRYERSVAERSIEARVRRNPTAKTVADPAIIALHEYRSARETGNADPHGFVRLPYATTAAKTGRTAATVKTALRRVAAAGLLELDVRPEQGPDGKIQKAAFIRIDQPETFLADLAETSIPPTPEHEASWGGKREPVRYTDPINPGNGVMDIRQVVGATSGETLFLNVRHKLYVETDEPNMLTGTEPVSALITELAAQLRPPTAQVDGSGTAEDLVERDPTIASTPDRENPPLERGRTSPAQVGGSGPSRPTVQVDGSDAPRRCVDCGTPCGDALRCSPCATAAAVAATERRRGVKVKRRDAA